MVSSKGWLSRNQMPVLCSQFPIISTSLPPVLRQGVVENKQFHYFRTVYENFVNFCWLMVEWIVKIFGNSFWYMVTIFFMFVLCNIVFRTLRILKRVLSKDILLLLIIRRKTAIQQQVTLLWQHFRGSIYHIQYFQIHLITFKQFIWHATNEVKVHSQFDEPLL